jgi:uncharacterized protein
MRVDVSELLLEKSEAQVDVQLNLGRQLLSDDLDVASVSGTLHLGRTTEGIWVRGTLAVVVDLQCVRCLVPVERQLGIELDERFQLPPIDEKDKGEIYPIEADHHIDLAPVLREAVIVSTPMRVLCRVNCAGLCPTCGQDLNDGPCDCPADEIDPRMAALKALLEE